MTGISKKYHQTLANYFACKLLYPDELHNDTPNNRKLFEQPWQQMKAGMWRDLINTLVDLNFFLLIDSSDTNILIRYWNQVLVLSSKDESLSGEINILNFYEQAWSIIDDNTKYVGYGCLGYFFHITGSEKEAAYCLKKEEDYFKNNLSEEETLLANLNDQGLLLLDKNHPGQALDIFEKALVILEKGAIRDKKTEGTLLMNAARAFRELKNFDASRHFLNLARQSFADSSGINSPGFATVTQSLGNLAQVEKDYENGYKFHKEAYEIRLSSLGLNHPDTARSLYNLANAEAGLLRASDAIEHLIKSIEIFNEIGGNILPDTKHAQAFLDQILEKTATAEKKSSGYGLVLLIYNSDTDKKDLFQSLEITEKKICECLTLVLKNIWNDLLKFGNAAPLLIIFFPGFDKAIHSFCSTHIFNLFPKSLLQWVNIPSLFAGDNPKNIDSYAKISMTRRKFLKWIEKFNLNTIMVRPLNNVNAFLDRPVLKHIERGENALMFEEVDFTETGRMLSGLNTGDKNPRPAVMPFNEWKEDYSPTIEDGMATGTFFINFQQIQKQFPDFSNKDLTHPVEKWAMDSFLAIAKSPFSDQLNVYEKLFSNLVSILKSGSISCPNERGIQIVF